jgi:DinB family protein
MPTITQLASMHATAIQEMVDRATPVAASQWNTPRGDGKWTPAQEVRHVTLGIEAFIRDLRGQGKLRTKGKWWQRIMWRWTVLPRILKTGQLVRGVRAPREVRPPDEPGDRDSLLGELMLRAREFEQLVIETSTRTPRRRVTHPYFGPLSLKALLRLGVVHVRHHAAYLPAVPRDGIRPVASSVL